MILYADVARAYVNVRTLQARMAYAQSNIDAQRGTLELTKVRFNAGLAPELDVFQSSLNLARTEARLPQLRLALEQTIHRLGVLLGEGSQHVRALLESTAPIPAPPAAALVSFPADVVRQRPDIRRAERTLAAQTARIGVAAADLYPRFALFGNLGLESIEGGDFFDAGSRAWSLGPSFRWSLLSGGRVRGNIAAEKARTEQALRFYEQSVLLAMAEVESTLAALARDKQSCAQTAAAVEAARRSVELVTVLYRSGLTDFQNVLIMEDALAAQEDALATMEGRISEDMILLYKALGGGWSVPQPAAPVDASVEQSDKEQP